MPMGFRRTSKHRHLDESSSIPQAEQGHSPLGLFLPWVQGMAPIACPWGGPIQAERIHPGRAHPIQRAPLCALPTGHIQRMKTTQAPPPLVHCVVLWCQHLPAHIGLEQDLVQPGLAAHNRAAHLGLWYLVSVLTVSALSRQWF